MGGTEIGDALDWVFRNRIRGMPTAVIVLTDGDVRSCCCTLESDANFFLFSLSLLFLFLNFVLNARFGNQNWLFVPLAKW